MFNRPPTIFLLLALALLVIFLVFQSSSNVSTPNILLITIDALRADRLGSYGYARRISPNLDELAKNGIVFENAFCVLPQTVPSHASILFGTWPRIHGSTNNSTKITNRQLPYLPQLMKEAGYSTAAILSAEHLGKALETFPGFDSLKYPQGSRPSNRTLRVALRWLQANQAQKFFLWIHLWEPHGPYGLHPELMAEVNPNFDDDFEEGYEFQPPGFYTEQTLKGMIDLYNNEIAFVDRQLGRFLEQFRTHSFLDNTLTIVTSDHGETLDELVTTHNYAFDHSKFLVDHEIHVPLIMLGPDDRQPGRRVTALTSLIDLFPTILEFANVDIPSNSQGFSLRPHVLNRETSIPPRLVFIQRRTFLDPPLPSLAEDRFEVRSTDFKLVYDAATGESKLYRVGDDSHEVGQSETEAARRLEQRLKQWLTMTEGVNEKGAQPISEEEMEVLRSLGYVH
jgi:arylsulfatase A-like enzyme